MHTGVVDHKVDSADLGGEPEGDNESNEGFGGEHPSGGCGVLAERAGDLKEKALGRAITPQGRLQVLSLAFELRVLSGFRRPSANDHLDGKDTSNQNRRIASS